MLKVHTVHRKSKVCQVYLKYVENVVKLLQRWLTGLERSTILYHAKLDQRFPALTSFVNILCQESKIVVK